MTLTDAGARLLPGISDGLAAFARAVELVRATAADAPLIVTTTNAFAARWLFHVCRIGVNATPISRCRLSARTVWSIFMPAQRIWPYGMQGCHPKVGFHQTVEDRHWPACAPTVMPTSPSRPKVIDLRGRTLIHAAWLPEDDAAPTWKRWLSAARAAGQSVPEWSGMRHLTFARTRMRSKQL